MTLHARTEATTTEGEWTVVAHLRGWCHNSATCAICAAENRAYKAERDLDRVISG